MTGTHFRLAERAHRRVIDDHTVGEPVVDIGDTGRIPGWPTAYPCLANPTGFPCSWPSTTPAQSPMRPHRLRRHR